MLKEIKALIFIILLNSSFAYAAGTSVDIPASAIISQGISGSASTVSFGNFSTGATMGGNLSLDNISCTTVAGGEVQALSGAACGTLTVDAAAGQEITIALVNAGNFAIADGSGHVINGQISLSNNHCYASGNTPLCSSIKIGGSLSVQGLNNNPGGVYSTTTGGDPAHISLTYV